MEQNKTNQTDKIQFYYKLTRTIAIVASAFSLIICILMIANYFQTKAIDPLNTPALQQLVEKLDENPKDQAIREEIRALDLLARKAYFTSIWQLQKGAYLLLWGNIFG